MYLRSGIPTRLCADVVNNTQITVKTVMRLIKDKMTEQDNEEFATELVNDRNQPNGNKQLKLTIKRFTFCISSKRMSE
jgi:hypothetical protein